jgi:lysine biosynthesis protein LysW
MESLECPVCDAEIPLEGEGVGDLVVCSYCQMTFKVISKKDGLSLTDEFE